MNVGHPPSPRPLHCGAALAELLSGLTLSAEVQNGGSSVAVEAAAAGGALSSSASPPPLRPLPTPVAAAAVPEAVLAGLSVSLFPHQLVGLQWMQRREDEAKGEGFSPSGGIVADEAGLGKTLMTIALILAHRGELCPCSRNARKGEERDAHHQPTLIVCPRGVVQQWVNEVAAHCRAGALSVLRFLSPTEKSVSLAQLQAVDVVVTSYETVRAQHQRWTAYKRAEKQREDPAHSSSPPPPPPSPPPPLFSMAFHRVVADEAHRLRSRKAQVTAAMLALSARHRFYVTATPIHNSIDDLHTAFAFLRYQPYAHIKEWKVSTHPTHSAAAHHTASIASSPARCC